MFYLAQPGKQKEVLAVKSEADVRKWFCQHKVNSYVSVLLANRLMPYIYSTVNNVTLTVDSDTPNELWIATDGDSLLYHTPVVMLMRELKVLDVAAYTNNHRDNGSLESNTRLYCGRISKYQEDVLLHLLDWISFGKRQMPAVNMDSIFPDSML